MILDKLLNALNGSFFMVNKNWKYLNKIHGKGFLVDSRQK